MSIPNYKIWVSFVTVGLIVLTLLVPKALVNYGGHLAIVLILLLGVPHGATDHILFKHVRKDYNQGWLFRFFMRYFLLMGLLSLVWWGIPELALMIFLAISSYHFGQSQWHHLRSEKGIKYLLYIVWGAFVLAAPLLWNYEETAPIIKQLIGSEVLLGFDYQLFMPFAIIAIIVFLTLILYFDKIITGRKLLEEWAVLALLSVLFYTTSLLIGFAIYFVFWHSIDSVKDQITQLHEVQPDYTVKKYLRQVIPFTLIAFGSIGLFVLLSPAELLSNVWISQFFIMISIVTLPHSLLMDSFLESKMDSKKIKSFSQTRQRNKLPARQVHVI